VSKVKYTVKLLNFGNVSLLRRHTHSLLHLSLCKHTGFTDDSFTVILRVMKQVPWRRLIIKQKVRDHQNIHNNFLQLCVTQPLHWELLRTLQFRQVHVRSRQPQWQLPADMQMSAVQHLFSSNLWVII